MNKAIKTLVETKGVLIKNTDKQYLRLGEKFVISLAFNDGDYLTAQTYYYEKACSLYSYYKNYLEQEGGGVIILYIKKNNYTYEILFCESV